MASVELRSTIFVGNIAVFCSEAELHQHFSSCGEIQEIRLARSEDQSKHLSYGFIRYANVACAQLAMRTLNGSILCGRPLKVDKAQSRTDRFMAKTTEKQQRVAFNSASVHITFISHQTRKIINEETLRFLFYRFGDISDVIITKHNVDERSQKQSGYGFVHFPLTQEGIASALKMSEVVSDLMIDDVNYKCKLSHDLEVRLNFPSKQALPPTYTFPDSSLQSRSSPTSLGGSLLAGSSSLSDTCSVSTISSTPTASGLSSYHIQPPPPQLSMPVLPSPLSLSCSSEMSPFYGGGSSFSSGSVSQLQSPSMHPRSIAGPSQAAAGLYSDMNGMYSASSNGLTNLRRTESGGGGGGGGGSSSGEMNVSPRGAPRSQSQSSSTFRALMQADNSTTPLSSFPGGSAPPLPPMISTTNHASSRYGQNGLHPEVLADHLRYLGLENATSAGPSPRSGSTVSSLSYDSVGSSSAGVTEGNMMYYPELQRGSMALLGMHFSSQSSSSSSIPPAPSLLPPSPFHSHSPSPRAVTAFGAEESSRGPALISKAVMSATTTPFYSYYASPMGASSNGVAMPSSLSTHPSPSAFLSGLPAKMVPSMEGTSGQDAHTAL